MAPARPRGVDDSRSETSSSITNLKDRSLLGPAGTSAIAKGKRVNSTLHSGLSVNAKTLPNGTSATAPVDSDSNVARVRFSCAILMDILEELILFLNGISTKFQMSLVRCTDLTSTDPMAYTPSDYSSHLPSRAPPTNFLGIHQPTCRPHPRLLTNRLPIALFCHSATEDPRRKAPCSAERRGGGGFVEAQGQRAK
jgi:hypothetical protein